MTALQRLTLNPCSEPSRAKQTPPKARLHRHCEAVDLRAMAVQRVQTCAVLDEQENLLPGGIHAMPKKSERPHANPIAMLGRVQLRDASKKGV